MPTFGGGIVADVFVNVAEFVTNITAAPVGELCELPIVEAYSFAVGAAAGATVTMESHTWGPVATASTVVFYTTLASACAVKKNLTVTSSAAAAASGGLQARDLTVKTISKTQVYTGVACLSPGLVNCPPALQTTTQETSTLTLVTSVSSGVVPTFPASTSSSVTSTIPFGSNVQKLATLSGTPTSYVPGPMATAHTIVDGKTGGVSNKVIIGVSVGVGIPVVIGLVALCSYVDTLSALSAHVIVIAACFFIHGPSTDFATIGFSCSGRSVPWLLMILSTHKHLILLVA
jgi:hypothetical protein